MGFDMSACGRRYRAGDEENDNVPEPIGLKTKVEMLREVEKRSPRCVFVCLSIEFPQVVALAYVKKFEQGESSMMMMVSFEKVR